MRAEFSLLAVLFLGYLAGSSTAQRNVTVCDGTCQDEQLAGLNMLFSALGANRTPSATARIQTPTHCSWVGIVCCDGNLTAQFSSASLSCLAAYGVAGIALPAQGLRGTLPAQPWSALASTLQFLDMSGSQTATQPQLFEAS